MRMRLVSLGMCMLLVLGLATIAGCSGGAPSSSSGSKSLVAPAPAPPSDVQGGSSAPANAAASSDRLVIKNASMKIQVDDLAGAIASLRAYAEKVGGSVSELTVEGNSDSPAPNTAHSASETVPIPGPASASMTLRVPAPKLSQVVAQTNSLGRVVSQSSDESDVTQKHIDLSAHLANLQAEEARLRALLARAGNVNDLLQVERELARVQGDVESMQQQLAYLDSQIAMATLTVSLDEPGPIVRPWSGGWGLVDSITQGIQGAAGTLRILITTLLTLSPLIVLGGLLWWFLAWLTRRSHARREALGPVPAMQPGPQAAPAPVGPPPSGAQPPGDQPR
jgi:hypothetical protein